MARGKGGLGRGLDSLFEDAAPVFESEHAAVETLPLREIEPDPDQPRKTFEQETLSELAASIAEHGLLQPIAVRPRPMGGYSIVAGERRWRASRMAGLTEVPVVIKDVSDEQAMELALVENLQREDLDPVEEAAGIRELMTRCDLTQEQAARKLGKSRSALANSLRLLNLPETVLELLKSGFINTGHAKVVLGLDDLLTSPVDGSGYHDQYGLLGSNKATEEKQATAANETRLGVTTRPLTKEEEKKAETTGLLVTQASGPAAKAGIRAGDILVSADGKLLKSRDDLLEQCKDNKVLLLVQRNGGRIFIPVKLQAKK